MVVTTLLLRIRMALAEVRGLRLLAGILTATLCFFLLQYSETESWSINITQLPGLTLSLVFGLLAAPLLEAFNHQLDQKISYRSQFGWRLLLGWLSSIFLLLTAFLASVWLVAYALPALFDPLVEAGPNGQQLRQVILKACILLAIVLFFDQIAYTLRFSWHDYAIARLTRYRREKAMTEWRYQTLKAQLSPHYLFNNLNTISALLHEKPVQAALFIRQLAASYRYILAQRNRLLVPMQDELSFVNNYLSLLQIRFGEQIRLHNNIAPTDRRQLPPLSLQLLIENAVKHNPPSAEQPLHIWLSIVGDGRLEVRNNRLPGTGADSFRIGLQHLRELYSLHQRRAPEINDGNEFSVRLDLFAEAEA